MNNIHTSRAGCFTLLQTQTTQQQLVAVLGSYTVALYADVSSTDNTDSQVEEQNVFLCKLYLPGISIDYLNCSVVFNSQTFKW